MFPLLIVYVCAVNGQPAIPHGSRVKVRLQSPQGWWADRLPAFIKWATVPAGVMGATYDGIYWDPPAGERHEWWVRGCFALSRALSCSRAT